MSAPSAAGQDVRAGPTRDHVGTAAAIDGVGPRPAGDGVAAAEIGADDRDAIGAGEAGGVDRHGVGHRQRRADLNIIQRAVAIGVGGRDLAVRYSQIEAGGVHIERDGVDVGDGGEGGQVIGAGSIQPQRVDRAGLRSAVDGLAGGKSRDGADHERVGPGAAGQNVRAGPTRDGVVAGAAIDGVDARPAIDGVGTRPAGDGVAAAEIGADDGDAIGAGQAGGVDRHGVGHRQRRADLKVIQRAVAIGVGGRDLAVRHRQVEAGGVHIEGDGVDVADGGEGGEIIGAGSVQPQRIEGAGLGGAVDGLAGGKVRGGADHERVGPGAAGQDVRAGPARDGVVAGAAIDGVDARPAIDGVVPAPPVMVSAPPRFVPTTVMRLVPVRPAALIVTALVIASDALI